MFDKQFPKALMRIIFGSFLKILFKNLTNGTMFCIARCIAEISILSTIIRHPENKSGYICRPPGVKFSSLDLSIS